MLQPGGAGVPGSIPAGGRLADPGSSQGSQVWDQG